ncbi:MAG: 1-acylglycerol-3-phosphate O-acyltransferase [Escherichia coli]|nr:1-acylglycerol-3-phosphate O-acyltransferase [Escherichia coli]
MLYIFRLIITVIYSILVCVFGSIYCLFSPRNPKHVATFGHMFGVTASNIVQPPTVTVGKKSLLWIPFFGQLYWLTGNLLIDRNNRTKAHGTIAEVVNHFKKRRISIWMFPEGTRSRGRGLLPFKTGAFHAAIAAGVPIIPVCVSTTSNKINLNRLHNGLVIVEMLPPIDVSQYGKDQVRELAAHCRSIMEQKIAELDKEVAEREAAGKV